MWWTKRKYYSENYKIEMIQRYLYSNKIGMVAIIFMIATFLISCKEQEVNEKLDLNEIPRQIVKNMSAVQTNNADIQMRLEANLMEIYKNDTTSFELFPNGFNVYGYNSDGLLETHIYSDEAKHTTMKEKEKWEAYGNVVIKNFVKGERIETDTIYWDRQNGRIFTHDFVKLHSPNGFMQGFGMESDEMARNAIILRPFDSYGIITDSTKIGYIDTVNFIGPILKSEKGRF